MKWLCYDLPAFAVSHLMEHAVSASQILRFGLFELDVARTTLTRKGVRVKIQDQPFRVLVMLLENPGEIVSREHLRKSLWQEGTFVDFDGSLNVILKKLRAALDDDSDNPRFIETVPRRGYRFIAPVSKNGSVEPATLNGDGGGDHSAGTNIQPVGITATGQPGIRPFLIYTCALALLVATGVGWLHWNGKKSSAKPKTMAATPPIPMRKSLAVLGFRNASGRSADIWLSTAFSEMLSTELAAGEKLRLVSGQEIANLERSSPWSNNDTLDKATTERIGRTLNSDFLVLGSYTIVGKSDHGQLRMDVRLQDAKTGEILAETAEIGGSGDLFDLVSRVGGKLRDRLGIPRLEQPAEANVLASLPAKPEAARLYSLGLAKLRDYDYLSARGLFEEAIKADPKFPLAYSMLSRADIFLGHDAQAKAEARKGLDLANGLSRVQRMEIEAIYYQANGDRAKAAETYRVLFNLFPDSLDDGLQLAKFELESYQPDAALETVRQLRRLPPPASDDPSIDLREAYILYPRDPEATDRLFHTAAEKAQAQGKKLIYAKAEQNICYANRKHLQSPPECLDSYEMFIAGGNRSEAGSSLQLLAEANRLTGHDLESVPLYEQALRMFKEAGHREMVGVTLNNLSLVLESEGQWNRAEQSYRQAKTNFDAVNDRANASAAIGNVADIEVWRGHLKQGAEMYSQAWELAVSSGRMRPEPAHIQYATLLLMRGEVEQARREIDPQIASLAAYRGDPWDWASAIVVRGDIQKAAGELESARKSYQEALELLKNSNSSIASAQVALAGLSLIEGDTERAESLLREAVATFEKDKSTGDVISGYTILAQAELAANNQVEAKRAAEKALRLADLRQFPVVNLPLRLVQAEIGFAEAKQGSAGANDLASVTKEIRAVIQESHQLGLYKLESEGRLALGKLQMSENLASGRAQLNALSSESHARGLQLIARQAEQALTRPRNLARTASSRR